MSKGFRQAALAAVGVTLAAIAILTLSAQRPARDDLLVAAAASLSGLAPQLAQACHDATGLDVRFNFAGSNTLARQIVEGARADVFVSADEAQMDVVEQAGRIVEGTRTAFIGNQLVVVVSKASRAALARAEDLGAADVRRMAMGDPAAVPAGVYGRQWLERVGVWPAVQPKVVPLPSSPAVLAAVVEGRADAGIVYASDALIRPVHVAFSVPVDQAPRIRYPAAAITGGQIPLARRFLAFLQTEAAQQVFEAGGFRALDAHAR